MHERDPLSEEYAARRPRSADLNRRGRSLFPAAGATHFTRVGAPFRPYIARAEGSRKWDVDGHEYVDYVMGHGALVLGHGHPAVVAAVQRQAALGLHYGDNHQLEVEWGERIRELVPTAERVEFFASGQEANLLAIRLSRIATGRRKILRFVRNYHGWADELAAPGAPGTVAEYVVQIPANDPSLLERHLATRDYALVMIEGGGGYLSGRLPTDWSFFQALPDVAQRTGTVLLLDEVVTGFREAPGGWQELLGIRPDLTTLGKAVSGGLPSGVLAGRADLFAPLSPGSPPDRLVIHGGTWNAVPVTCAAGIAALETYRGGAPQREAAAAAKLLRHQGNQMLRRLGVSARLFGRSVTHLYLGPCDPGLAGDDDPPTRDPALLVNPAVGPAHRRLDLHLLHRGIATMRGEAFVLSAVHSPADVEQTVAALESALVAMQAEGTLPD